MKVAEAITELENEVRSKQSKSVYIYHACTGLIAMMLQCMIVNFVA